MIRLVSHRERPVVKFEIFYVYVERVGGNLRQLLAKFPGGQRDCARC